MIRCWGDAGDRHPTWAPSEAALRELPLPTENAPTRVLYIPDVISRATATARSHPGDVSTAATWLISAGAAQLLCLMAASDPHVCEQRGPPAPRRDARGPNSSNRQPEVEKAP